MSQNTYRSESQRALDASGDKARAEILGTISIHKYKPDPMALAIAIGLSNEAGGKYMQEAVFEKGKK